MFEALLDIGLVDNKRLLSVPVLLSNYKVCKLLGIITLNYFLDT